MPKASSPMRLEQGLVRAATLSSGLYKRSIAEQVEYWADIGRRVEKVIDPDTLLAIQAGLATVQVVPKDDVAVDADQLFARMEDDRRSGELAASVSSGALRYQASLAHPGMLERIDADGERTLGQFQQGQFIRYDVDEP